MEPECGEHVLSETESMESETSLHASVKPIIPEYEFGVGTADCPYQPQMWRDMGKLFQQEILSDVMLMAEGQSIPCHKFLLAAASEYFYDRLVVESSAVDHNLLEIEGITFQTLKVIVSYLYTGNINIMVENAAHVVPACNLLKMYSACDTCESFLHNKVSPANCIGLYTVATVNGVQQLREKARKVMVNNFKEVVATPEFLDMSTDEVEEYIQNEDLSIPNEDPVYDAVVSWIKYRPDERAASFSRLINSVRFRFCSSYCLKHILPKEPLMETLEHQRILVSALKHQDTESVCWDNVGGDCVDCSVLPRKGYQRKSSMVIIGGRSDPDNVIRSDCWHLQNEEWKVMQQSPIPTTTYLFNACIVRDGIVVSGGFTFGRTVKCWLLSTTNYRWSPLPDLNTARARHSSVSVEGQVYVIGGEGQDGIEISSVESLQKYRVRWEALPDIPKPLVYAMAVAHGQYIYVFGGTDMNWANSKSCYVYGTKGKSWHTLPDMPRGCMCGSVVVWKDMIYLVGGFRRSCMSFNPATTTWSTLSQCVHEHGDAPALVWEDRILVCGGRSKKTTRVDDGKPAGTSVIEEYDPETDTWTVSQIELPMNLSAHFVFSIEAND